MSYTKIHPDHFSTILGLNNKMCFIQKALEQDSSKINRIQGSSNYSRTISYSVGTSNVTVIVHTGTTALGVETITETFTYVNPAVNGSNITSIQYS
jgi:hypothetical protein